MRAAGLNPVLSATRGGASTPSGSMASMPAFENIATSAADVALKKETVTNMKEQNKLTKDQAALARAQARKTMADTAVSAQDARIRSAQADKEQLTKAPYKVGVGVLNSAESFFRKHFGGN